MKRTVSTPHLVLGIIFAGIATLWFVGAATDAKFHDTAPGFPLVLIGAGVIGLVASLNNSRNRKQVLAEQEDPALDDLQTEDSDADPDADPDADTDTDTDMDTEATTVITEENS